MKKLLAICLLAAAVCVPYAALADGGFTTVSVPFADGERLFGENYQSYDHLLARYVDDKTPIPLSRYYDGSMYATVPEESADREIEAYISEDMEFTDDAEDSYELYVMGRAAARGVIKGDTDGKARPSSNVTRAEAAAMITRLLGIEANYGRNSGFTDVDENAWYAEAVTAAREYGIINGDTDTLFDPNRSVTREELTAMAARALWRTGLQRENNEADISEFKDAGEISDWALSAYGTLAGCNITDYEDSGETDAEGFTISNSFAHPKEAATRFEASELIERICTFFLIYPSGAAIEYGFDKEMPVIDGSTSTYPFTEAVYRNLFSNGNRHPDMPKSHSKSHASYERLINGEVDMLFASVYPAEDIVSMAEENGVELELIPIAYDAMIFFTNADNPAENLTSEQITNIYVNNAYSNWNEIGGADALLYPYCRNNDSGSHAQMERHFLNGNEINEKIRSETTSISMSNVLTDVMGAQTDDPKGYALGYSIYYYFNNMDEFYNTKTSLKLLKIDGVMPTDATIADGSYPLANNTYIVIRADEPTNSPARKMAEFMLTEAGQYCVEEAGYGPLNR